MNIANRAKKLRNGIFRCGVLGFIGGVQPFLFRQDGILDAAVGQLAADDLVACRYKVAVTGGAGVLIEIGAAVGGDPGALSVLQVQHLVGVGVAEVSAVDLNGGCGIGIDQFDAFAAEGTVLDGDLGILSGPDTVVGIFVEQSVFNGQDRVLTCEEQTGVVTLAGVGDDLTVADDRQLSACHIEQDVVAVLVGAVGIVGNGVAVQVQRQLLTLVHIQAEGAGHLSGELDVVRQDDFLPAFVQRGLQLPQIAHIGQAGELHFAVQAAPLIDIALISFINGGEATGLDRIGIDEDDRVQVGFDIPVHLGGDAVLDGVHLTVGVDVHMGIQIHIGHTDGGGLVDRQNAVIQHGIDIVGHTVDLHGAHRIAVALGIVVHDPALILRGGFGLTLCPVVLVILITQPVGTGMVHMKHIGRCVGRGVQRCGDRVGVPDPGIVGAHILDLHILVDIQVRLQGGALLEILFQLNIHIAKGKDINITVSVGQVSQRNAHGKGCRQEHNEDNANDFFHFRHPFILAQGDDSVSCGFRGGILCKNKIGYLQFSYHKSILITQICQGKRQGKGSVLRCQRMTFFDRCYLGESGKEEPTCV